MKRLVPLGFTKSDIRKELYLSEEGQSAASTKLLEPGKAELVSSFEDLGVGEEEIVDDWRSEGKEGGGGGGGGKKTFAIQSIQVSAVACRYVCAMVACRSELWPIGQCCIL